MVGKIATSDARAVQDTAQALDIATLAEVAQRISSAPRITVFGIGASGLAAQDLQQKLVRLGLNCSAPQDVHEALVVTSLLAPGCVAIGISNTGQTAEVLEPLRLGAEVGVTAVAITNAPSSRLAQQADHLLVTAAQESLLRSGATASRIAQLTVIDCILVAVAPLYAGSGAPRAGDHACRRGAPSPLTPRRTLPRLARPSVELTCEMEGPVCKFP